MGKKLLIPFTEVIKALFAYRRADKTVPGAAAVTHIPDFTGPAILRQSIQLVLSEFSLPRALQQARQGSINDISQ